MTIPLPEEFLDQYEAELRRRLRRRVLWYAGAMAALWGVLGAFRTVKLAEGASLSDVAVVVSLVNALVKPAISLGVLGYVLRHPPQGITRVRMILVVTVLVIALGAISQVTAPFIVARVPLITGVDPETGARMEAKLRPVIPLVVSLVVVFTAHFSASLFIPWSLREAVRPLLWLLAIAGVAAMVESPAPLRVRLVFVALLPLAGAPGVLLSWWRYVRFRRRFGQAMVADRYGEMKRELVDARRIHEALFPPALTRGSVRLAYRYEPMRQIGGDFLYAHPVLPAPAAHDGPLSVVVIDITGHGVPAALTVGGLHGELERMFLERPDSTPGQVLQLLNRHAGLLLARHSVFPSALCLRADPAAGRLDWASAGHPPAFLRRAGGAIETLDPTACLLGVCDAQSFGAGERSVEFGPGDAVVAYTDGVSEAVDANGAMLRDDGVREAIASAPPVEGGLAAAVLAAVARHRHGPPADDTLIVEVRRPGEAEAV